MGVFVTVRCVRACALVFCLPVCLSVNARVSVRDLCPSLPCCMHVSGGYLPYRAWYEAGAAQRVVCCVCRKGRATGAYERRFSAKDLEEDILLERRDHGLDDQAGLQGQLAPQNKGCEW